MIRTSRHFLNQLNTLKYSKYKEFVQEYRRVAREIIAYIWEYGYEDYDPKSNKFNLPKFLDYNSFDWIKTDLSARALSSLVTQVSGMLRACTDKQKRRIYVYEQKPSPKLKKKIDKFKTSAPSALNINPELSSKCADFEKSETHGLHGHVRLKSIGKAYGEIIIPIIRHRHSKGFESKKWNMKASFLCGQDRIEVRWEKDIPHKTEGSIVGADPGQTTIITFSDGQVTQKTKHGTDLKYICDKLSRKKKGSKAFRRAQQERDNIINYSIKQLNLSGIKQIKFEQNKNLRFGQNTSRSLKHFTYTAIEKQIKNVCELNGVHLILEPSAFYSQRCCACGWVQKSNRKGKRFSCKHCRHEMDSDLNAATNHEFFLPDIRGLVKSRMNIEGFFWDRDGVYDRFGQEFRVPDSELNE